MHALRPISIWFRLSGALLLVATATVAPLRAQTAVPTLADLSLEQLLDLEITSVGKKETRLFRSPAAVTVVTGDDVRRLGITSLAEALRGVPGMQVARVNADTWAIGARGFNQQYSNKLLVLQDGRSIYTPSFGGVFWGVQDMVLEDLDRIEVVRGPGATLWGANAVNGVINITSKSARDTQGTLLATSYGTEDRPAVTLRHGGTVGPELHYRAYVKYFDRDGFLNAETNEAPDRWSSTRTGFRADWTPSADDLVTIQGDYDARHSGRVYDRTLYAAPFVESVTNRDCIHGANLLARWTRTYSETSHLSVQSYVDHFRNPSELRDTADIQLEHRLAPARGHDVVWGLGYRFTTDDFTSAKEFAVEPLRRDLNLFTAFVQDEIEVEPERWHVIAGVKFEHNDFTGLEIQPGVRALWMPSNAQTAWVSAARAVGVPARMFRGMTLELSAMQPPASPAVVVRLLGNPALDVETVDAFEAGYRIEPSDVLAIDVAACVNRYHGIFGITEGVPVFEVTPGPPHIVAPVVFGNVTAGESRGAEVSVQWLPTASWRIVAAGSWLDMDLWPDDSEARGNARRQASVRSYLSLPGRIELNGFVSFTDAVESRNRTAGATSIPSYVRLDLGVIWRPSDSLEVGVWVNNLLDARHPEFSSQDTLLLAEVPRALSARTTWRF